MSMPFHESIRGGRFFDHQMPQIIEAVNRLAEATECANSLSEQNAQPKLTVESVFRDELMNRILKFVTENDLDADVCRTQLASMWTTYCLLNDYEVDTADYDNDLRRIYNAICEYTARDMAAFGAQHYEWPASYEIFDDWMCAELV